MDKLDLILLMGVNPGFGGQKFIPATLRKLQAARARIDAYEQESGRRIRLEIDGGVKVDNMPKSLVPVLIPLSLARPCTVRERTAIRIAMIHPCRIARRTGESLMRRKTPSTCPKEIPCGTETTEAQRARRNPSDLQSRLLLGVLCASVYSVLKAVSKR